MSQSALCKNKERYKISNKWLKYVHLLFLTIAEHELNIEELRLDISATDSFNPKAIFNYIDEE